MDKEPAALTRKYFRKGLYMSAKSIVAPPELYSLEAEQAVVGSLLMDPAIFAAVRQVIRPDDFYLRKARMVFEAIEHCSQNGGVDHLAVTDELERAGQLAQVGGASYLVELINVVPSAINAERYAEIVRNYAMRRSYVTAATQIAKLAHDADMPVDEVRNSSEGAVLACRRETDAGIHQIADVAGKVYDGIGVDREVTPTGIRPLDALLAGGLEPAVYIVAARPSMGKTAFLLEILAHICSIGQRCALFSIEMSAEQIAERLASRRARVSLQKIKQGEAHPGDVAKYTQAVGEIAGWPLVIVDRATLTANDILAAVRQEQMLHGQVRAVFIDGLWLMTAVGRHSNRVQEVGSISRDVKRVQRDLNVPVVMAHQLSRACEIRGDKRPILSDLRETGDVEQDADVVLMMYREGYYDQVHPEANVMETWVRKNRLHGPSGECVKTYWKGEYMGFEPLARDPKF